MVSKDHVDACIDELNDIAEETGDDDAPEWVYGGCDGGWHAWVTMTADYILQLSPGREELMLIRRDGGRGEVVGAGWPTERHGRVALRVLVLNPEVGFDWMGEQRGVTHGTVSVDLTPVEAGA